MTEEGISLRLTRLTEATDAAQQDTAWAEFVAAYSAVVLHTCRSLTRDHDAAMDAYAHALEALRADGCRRLRAYRPSGEAKFSSWLVVVTRRLVLDHFRQRYGRSRSILSERQDDQHARRALEDLVGAELDPDQLEHADASADAAVRRKQLTEAVRRVIADLAPRDRLLLALRFQDQRSVRDIATSLGLASVFHVYRQLGRVLSAVRRALAERGVEDPEP